MVKSYKSAHLKSAVLAPLNKLGRCKLVDSRWGPLLGSMEEVGLRR